MLFKAINKPEEIKIESIIVSINYPNISYKPFEV